jgi:hypothetical protein
MSSNIILETLLARFAIGKRFSKRITLRKIWFGIYYLLSQTVILREKMRCLWEDNIKMDFKDKMRAYRLDSSGSGYGPVAGCCQYGDERWGFIKAGEFSNL